MNEKKIPLHKGPHMVSVSIWPHTMNKNLHKTVNLGKSEQQTNSTSAMSAKVIKLEYPSTYNRLNNAFSPQTACDDRLALVSTNTWLHKATFKWAFTATWGNSLICMTKATMHHFYLLSIHRCVNLILISTQVRWKTFIQSSNPFNNLKRSY